MKSRRIGIFIAQVFIFATCAATFSVQSVVEALRQLQCCRLLGRSSVISTLGIHLGTLSFDTHPQSIRPLVLVMLTPPLRLSWRAEDQVRFGLRGGYGVRRPGSQPQEACSSNTANCGYWGACGLHWIGMDFRSDISPVAIGVGPRQSLATRNGFGTPTHTTNKEERNTTARSLQLVRATSVTCFALAMQMHAFLIVG